jgi:hypothetical protein
MRIVITEDKRNRLAINWFEEEYPDLKIYRHPGYEEIFVSDKGIFKMSYVKSMNALFIKDDIWDPLRSWFGFDNKEVSDLLLNWANKKFGFRAKLCKRVKSI